MSMSLPDELHRMIEKERTLEVGLSAHRIENGDEILINPDASFHPASTMKICVMYEVYRQARRGVFTLDDPIIVKNEFASIVEGLPYSLLDADDSEKDLYQRIGQTLTIRELVRRMITVSSNLATNLLIERVTPEQTTDFMRELGADSLIVRRGVEDGRAFKLGLNNASTARGFMNILMKLAKREVVSPDDSDEMMDILTGQQFNEMIPARLPAIVRVAHKTGWTGDYNHDVGIVYPPAGDPFVLVIMTKGFEKEEKAHPFIAQLAKTIYDHWTI
jgi:beta-lactamase class A